MPQARDAFLFLGLVAGSLAVYFHQHAFLEPARPLFALAVLGWLLASPSDRPLRTWLWVTLVAAELWLAQTWAARHVVVWLLGTFAGAGLAIRAGSRSMAYLLPGAENENGIALRNSIRRQLLAASGLFLAVYVWDGGLEPEAPSVPRALLLFLAALFFFRFLLLQSKHLGIAAAPLTAPARLVWSQRWPILALVFVLVATPFPTRWLGPKGDGPLLLTAALLFVLTGLLFALALARSAWPRSDVRRVSFLAGVGLAFVLAAVVSELQRETPERFTAFGGIAMAFLVVAPVVRATTKLFDATPRLDVCIPPPYFAVMAAPVTAASAFWHVATLRGLLLALAVLVTTYYLVVALRHGKRGVLYPLASLVCVIAGAVVPVSGAWEVFVLSLCFPLYAIDARQRIVSSSRARK